MRIHSIVGITVAGGLSGFLTRPCCVIPAALSLVRAVGQLDRSLVMFKRMTWVIALGAVWLTPGPASAQMT